MANTKVALLRYVKTDSGWRRCRVSYKGKAKVETLDTKGAVVIEKGAYQLKWYDKGNAVYSGAGDDLRQAINLYDQQVANLANKVAGRPVVELPGKRMVISNEAAKFVTMTEEAEKASRTVTGYRNVIAEFLELTGLTYVDEIADIDLSKYCAMLRKRNLEERTVANYLSTLTTFLAYCKIDHMKMFPKNRRPIVPGEKPVSYSEDHVKRFLAACDTQRNRLFFEFLLKTGAREKEATFLEWSDINFETEKVTIQKEKKLDLIVRGVERKVRFRSKSRKTRVIELESNLVEGLKAWRKVSSGTKFVFGTTSDIPNLHYIPVCKATAFRAGLSCGKCDQCRKSNNRSCKEWFLHRFRHTFATISLRRGLDIVSLQELMGHARVEQTARYVSHDEGVQTRLNVAFGAF